MLIMRSLGSSIKDGFAGIMIGLDSIIYRIVGWLYQVFVALSSARIFTSETFELFEERFYIILGIGMLFLLAYSLLRSIVNPDEFASGAYSMGKIVMNTITSLILIAVMPSLFNLAYQAQEVLLEENIIGKIILGSYSSASPKLTVTYDEAAACEALGLSGPPCTATYKGSNKGNLEIAGNAIAVDVFSSFFYPSLANSEMQTEDSVILYKFEYSSLEKAKTKFTEGAQALYKDISNYNQCGGEEDISYVYGEAAENCAMIANAIDESDYKERDILYRSLLQYTKTTGDFSGFGLLRNLVTEDEIDYSWFVSTIAGGFCIYVFLSYCLDMGLRAAKLGFAQLVAPIPILARILPNQKKMFDSWLKFTLSCFAEVFIRIAVIFLGIFMVTNLPDLQQLWSESLFGNMAVSSFKVPFLMEINASYGVLGFARVIIIIGILMFMKQATTIMLQALGLNISESMGSLNIRGKLKNMVGGETLLNATNKTRGALTGAIGAGYMSARNGGGFWRAALKGGHDGFQAGGGQFRRQGQQTYHDLTGDKYDGSFFRRGRSVMGNVNFQYDQSNRRLREDNLESMKNKVETYEHSEAFEQRIRNQKAQHQAEYGRIVAEQQAANAEAHRRFDEAETQARETEDRAKQQADAFRVNEAQIVADRMKNYQNGAEYNNLKHIAQGLAAQEAGYTNMTAEEQKKVVDKYFKEELAKSNSEEAKQYAKDMNRNINKEADEMLAKAKEESRRRIAEANKTYTDALRKAQEIAQQEQSKIDETVQKEVIKAIKNNPKGRAEIEYSNALSEVQRGEKVKKNKDMMDAFDQFYRDNGGNNNKGGSNH